MISHYLPPFVSRRANGDQQAACGQFITSAQHSAEPTCVECKDWLEDSADRNRERDAIVQRAASNYVNRNLEDRRAIREAGERA